METNIGLRALNLNITRDALSDNQFNSGQSAAQFALKQGPYAALLIR